MYNNSHHLGRSGIGMQGKQIRILLVDDDEDEYILTNALLNEFKHKGYSLDWAETYEAGLKSMIEGEYDVYLLDFRLGPRNGLELLKEAVSQGCRAPIILLTGRGGYDIDLQAMAAGAADYLVKHNIQGSILERSIRFALERKQAEEAIHKEAARAKALLRVAGRLNAKLNLKSVLEAVCEESCQAINANAASVHVNEHHNNSFYLSAACGLSWETADLLPSLLPSSQKQTHSPGEQIRLIPDIREVPEFQNTPIFEELGLRTVVTMRIVCDGEVFGNLNLYTFRNKRTFTDEDLALLRGLLDQAALAISNARLYEEERARNEELAAISHISGCLQEAQDFESMPAMLENETKQLLKSDWAVVVQAEKNGESLQLSDTETFPPRISSSSGTVEAKYYSEAFAKRSTVVIPNLTSPGPISEGKDKSNPAVIVPLLADAVMVGLLATGRELPFSKTEVQLLTSIGKIAGSSMYRARLSEEAQRRMRYTQALHKIDIAIASTLDLRLTLTTAIKQTIQQLGVDAANVMLLNKELGVMEYAAGWGFRTPRIRNARIPVTQGYIGKVVRERKLLQIEDTPALEELDRRIFPENEGFNTYIGVPLTSKGEVNGVLELYHKTRLKPDSEWIDFLETLAGQIAIAIDNALLFEGLQRSNADLARAYDTALEGWSRALDLRDKETEGHTQRVTRMALRLASAMGISQTELDQMRRGAILHDIGKMAIPDSILHKPGPLTDEEWDIMRKHSDYAYDLLAPISFLESSLDIPYCHHERWDGTGYPRRLKGEEIPIAARIFSVIDVWDALLSNRPYRKAWSMKKARDYIRAETGRHFDPKVGRKFLELVEQDAL
jgi:putative nucleotidyltransferase with HDIG domain